MQMMSLLRQGIPTHLLLPFMKIRCAYPRQQHVQEPIIPSLSTIHTVMASVVHMELEATKFLLRTKFMPKEVNSTFLNLNPCVIPLAPVTEVKVNVMKWRRVVAIGTRKEVNAVSALHFHILESRRGLELSNGDATIMVAPGIEMATFASNFSCGSQSILFYRDIIEDNSCQMIVKVSPIHDMDRINDNSSF